MPDEVNAYPLATPRVDFVPTILRPRSLTLSSPPSVRSSMLYAFSPTPEQSRPSTAYEHSKPQNNLRVPLHIPSASEVTLPNPHSEHGHDALVESPVDIPLPPPARLVTAPSYPGQPPAVPPSMSHSELSSAEDAVYSLERGPTPISQHSTMSVMLDDPDRYVNVHDLLLGRQLGSDAHLLGRDSPKTSPLEVSHAAGHQ
ncbi:hypothetical protein POSPLADRAFT_1031315 [Postia placenta MAD-698-R-SB12]|uniref:Uncharacterized protein n=1 Tax=Postia placenta MAD-698-R-SB12 TaxID=670580 RepID=A0A1X6NCG7_9APHY|nr:hypothetical protein POSPLADRAFT_1031315 [Postia placenta MAD-698-R-SB12]OSX66210.1 hypothetical protein POSPLADRAFT_1031315 [Postia placenta MAD-698-R-SB12]